MFFIGAAFAICQTPPVIVPDVEPGEPIFVTNPKGPAWFPAEHMRIRGPDGKLVDVARHTLDTTVRLSPKTPLTPGPYTLELFQDEHAYGAVWFERQTFEVRANIDRETLTGVSHELGEAWSFAESGIGAWVMAPEDAVVVMLEMRGVGIVDVERAHYGWGEPEAMWLTPAEPVRSGEVDVRVIALGTSRYTSAWKTLSTAPTHALSWNRHPRPKSYSGEMPPNTPVFRMPECSCIEPTSTEELEDAYALRDPQTGTLHIIQTSAHGIEIDGVLHPELDQPPRAIAEFDGTQYVLESGPWLMRYDGEQTTRQRVMGLDEVSIRKDDGDLTLDWTRDGHRWRQRAALDLSWVTTPRAVFHPLLVDQGAVNGKQIQGLVDARQWATETFVAFHYDGHMNIVGPYGEFIERVPIDGSRRLVDVTLFEAGIDIVHTATTPPYDDGLTTTVSWGPIGQRIEPARPAYAEFDYQEHRLFIGRGQAFVRTSNDDQSPPIRESGVFGIRNGEIAVASSWGNTLTVSAYRCGRTPVIPLRGQGW